MSITVAKPTTAGFYTHPYFAIRHVFPAGGRETTENLFNIDYNWMMDVYVVYRE